MRRILVIGGGIAGVESALTLARGLPDAQLAILLHRDELHVPADLVYVPFGVEPTCLLVSLLPMLQQAGVEVLHGDVRHVDLERGVAADDGGAEHRFDVLVAAPGASPCGSSGLQLQTVDDAMELRDAFERLLARTETGARESIVIRAAVDDAWPPPAYELAALAAAWRRARGAADRVSVTLVTAELSPFQWFEPSAADGVLETLRDLDVELASGVPEARFDDLCGDVTVDFPPLEPRRLSGLPGRGRSGWYDVDVDGRIDDRTFVVGDAAHGAFKAPFAAAWQARRMLLALGGTLDRLGRSIGGVPTDEVHHHIDLAERSLRVRLPVRASPNDPWLAHAAEVDVRADAPDRLAGLHVRASSAGSDPGAATAAARFRDLISQPV